MVDGFVVLYGLVLNRVCGECKVAPLVACLGGMVYMAPKWWLYGHIWQLYPDLCIYAATYYYEPISVAGWDWNGRMAMDMWCINCDDGDDGDDGDDDDDGDDGDDDDEHHLFIICISYHIIII